MLKFATLLKSYFKVSDDAFSVYITFIYIGNLVFIIVHFVYFKNVFHVQEPGD